MNAKQNTLFVKGGYHPKDRLIFVFSAILFPILFLFFFASQLHAQAPTFDWVKDVGGNTSTYISMWPCSMTTDASGNVYVTGRFNGKVTFGSITLPAPNHESAFISKQDPNGNFLWVKEITGYWSHRGESIAIGPNGNIFVCGQIGGEKSSQFGSITLNPTNPINTNSLDAFVCKLSPSGNFIWAKRIGGPGEDTGLSLAVDNSGNVVMTGYFQETADFDPGSGSQTMTTPSTGTNYTIFVCKLDNNGDYVWAKQMEQPANGGLNRGSAIVTGSNGDIYFLSRAYGKVDFDPGSGTHNIDPTTSNSGNHVLCKLTSAGNFVWAENVGGTSDDKGRNLAIDGSDNLYITGRFRGTKDFDPSSNTSNMTVLGALSDAFIAKYSSSGAFVWAKQLKNGKGMAIALDPSGNVYTTGYFNNTIDLDPGTGSVNITSSGSGYEVYISKLDNNGNYLWGGDISKGSGSNYRTMGDAIAISPCNDIYTAGEFAATSDFDPGSSTHNVSPLGYIDLFVHKLNQPVSLGVTASSNGPLCSGSTLNLSATPSGSSYSYDWTGPGGWTATGQNPTRNPVVAGTYKVVVTNAAGCKDSDDMTVSITTKPSPPTATSTQTFCGSKTIADLSATGTNLKWYSNSTGGSPLASNTPLVDGTTYYVSQTNGCESDRTAVTVQITPFTIDAGADKTITCGTSVQIGLTPSTPAPMAPPNCSSAASMIVQPAGGAYINDVTTTGGLTQNINNTNTLVDGDDPATTYIAFNRWYSDYTNKAVDAVQGGSFQLNLAGNKGPSGSNTPTFTFRVWIDWNNDGTFNNTNEQVYTSPTGSTSPFSFNNITINVPSAATVGTLRMRVRVKYGTAFVNSDKACTKSNPVGWPGQGNYDFISEVEDYAVIIKPSGGGSGGSGNNTYSWTPVGSLNDPTLPNPTATPDTTTMYTVTVTNASGCTAVDSVKVIVNNYQIPLFTINDSICKGETAPTLPTTSTNGITGSWSPSSVDNSTVATTQYTFTPDAGQCAIDTSVKVTVNPLPQPQFDAIPNSCQSSSAIQFNPTPTGGTFDIDGNAANSFDPATLSVGTHTVTYSYTDGNGCSASTSQNVEIYENPTYTASITNASCGNQDGVIILTPSGGKPTYTYSIDGGTTQTNDSTFTGLGVDTYPILITDGNNCSVTGQEIISQNGASTIDSIDVINPTCQGTCDGKAIVYVSGGGTPYTYSWEDVTNNSNAGTTQTATNLCEGQYKVVVTDAGGCSVIGTVTLKDPALADASFTFNDFCSGEANGANNITTPGGTFSFDPPVSDGATINPTTGEISNGVGGTTYTVKYTLGNGCNTSSTQDVKVTKGVNPSFVGDIIEGCAPLTVHFANTTASNTGGGCSWDFGDGTIINDCSDTVTHIYSSAGDFTVTLTMGNGAGCKVSESKANYIHVTPPAIADFTADPTTGNTENPIVHFTNNSQNASQFIWDFGDKSAPSVETNPQHKFPNDKEGTYIVSLIASNGVLRCNDTTSMIIKIEDELIYYIPNSFTPDRNDYNEVFKPVFTSGYNPQKYTLQIFDRWGELIFVSHNANIGWDGTYGGKTVQEGTYVWKIKFQETGKDKNHILVGHVNVLR